jgi:hypothetical protein
MNKKPTHLIDNIQNIDKTFMDQLFNFQEITNMFGWLEFH